MIEAGSYALPLIASDHPGNRTYIEHGVSGFLVEHGDPEALSRAVLDMLEARSRLASMGVRSRAIAEGFSWDNIALRYHEFFESVPAWA